MDRKRMCIEQTEPAEWTEREPVEWTGREPAQWTGREPVKRTEREPVQQTGREPEKKEFMMDWESLFEQLDKKKSSM